MKLAATIIGKATDQIIDKSRKIAGILLEAAESDLEFAAGHYLVTGTDREISLFDIAAAAIKNTGLPEELRGPLVGISDETIRIASFPFGTQICEVEVDVETGAVEMSVSSRSMMSAEPSIQ
jgi:carbon-monoxide dehydrogenase large subunit